MLAWDEIEKKKKRRFISAYFKSRKIFSRIKDKAENAQMKRLKEEPKQHYKDLREEYVEIWII